MRRLHDDMFVVIVTRHSDCDYFEAYYHQLGEEDHSHESIPLASELLMRGDVQFPRVVVESKKGEAVPEQQERCHTTVVSSEILYVDV